jgi:short subunit dehydrogenase-like uncharacterized protein
MMSRSSTGGYRNAPVMAEPPAQSGPIAVYGATGYTGRLVAAELRRRGADAVLAGRNPAKLEMVAEDIGGSQRTAAVSLDDAAGLRELLEPCAAVIACAGPFVRHGEAVLAAAVEAGTHYLDTTGEQTFMRTVFDRYGDGARERGIALVTAMGFDYVPGDLLAALVAEGMGELDEIVVAYGVRGFGATRGTAASGIEIMRRGGVEWRDRTWHPSARLAPGGSREFPPPVGRQPTIRWPGGEQLTVPRHVSVRTVTTLLSAGMVLPEPLGHLVSLAVPPLQLAMRTPFAGAAEAAVNRLPEGPSEKARRAARFAVVCDAKAAATRRRGSALGPDPYGLTARTTVDGALLAAAPGYARSGALAPAQAFDPAEFLDALSGFGVRYEVDPLTDSAAA